MYLVRIIVLSCLPFVLGAQTVFNRTYTIGGNNLTELLVTDTGYISVSANERGNKQMDFSVYDLAGNPLDTMSYNFDSVGNGVENCGKCLHTRHGDLYYAQFNSMASDTGYTLLMKLGQDLTIKETRNYNFRDSLGTQIKALAFDSDSTFLITGYAFRKKPPLLGKYDLLVAKFDTAFNLLWEKRIEDNRPNEDLGYIGNDILIDSYGSAIISGFGRYGPNLGLCARINPDNGNVLWLKEFNGTVGQGAMYTMDNQNGTYQFCQTDITELISGSGSGKYSKLRVGVMDTLGTILSYKDIGPEDHLIIPTDLIPTSDGNFYTAGIININGARNSFGLKFAPNGDSLWLRYYYHEDQQDFSNMDIFFETSDSGFIHAGYYADLFQSSGTGGFTWLLKTDQYGCDSIGCHKVGLYEARIPGLLEVFPNPSNGDFRLSWTYGPPETFALTIQDVSGTVIYRDETAFLSEQDYTVDLRQHPPGVYLLHLTLEGKHVVSRKLVIE